MNESNRPSTDIHDRAGWARCSAEKRTIESNATGDTNLRLKGRVVVARVAILG
jgi:hypothetical protein